MGVAVGLCCQPAWPSPRLKPRWQVRAIAGGLFAGLWTVVALLALEAAARWWQGHRVATNPLIQADLRRNTTLTEALDESLWEVQWQQYKRNARLAADVDGVPHEVRTNSHGFRSPEIQMPKPPGTFRIVCLGGSTTVEGRTNETTYPALVEARLRERFETDRIEVVNTGVSSVGSAWELERIEELLDFEPDLVLEYNFVNDLCWHILPELRQRQARLLSWARRSEFLRPQLVLGPEALRPGIEGVPLANLGRIGQACRRRDVEFVALSFLRPAPEHVTREEREFYEWNLRTVWEARELSFPGYCAAVDFYNHALKALSAREGFGYLPLAESLPGASLLFFDICHLTESGIAAKAEVVSRSLEPLVAARWRRFGSPERSARPARTE